MMKMSHLWPKRKAIALVICSHMTKFDIDLLLVEIEK